MKIFLSSRFVLDAEIERKWLKRTGCKYRCFSFASVDKQSKDYNKNVAAALRVCEKRKVEIMMDSGAFTLHKLRKKTAQRGKSATAAQQIDIDQLGEDMFRRYVKFCQKHHHKWGFFFTMDFRIHQPTIYRMQKRFAKYGLKPTPVFHGDDSVDWLDRYRDLGVDLIGIANNYNARSRANKKHFRHYLDKTFNHADKIGMRLHGLACTALSVMVQYPWDSIDSSTWSRNAIMGIIQIPNFEKLKMDLVHVSEAYSSASPSSYNNMTRSHQQQIRETCRDLGFDLDLLRRKDAAGARERHDFNGLIYANICKMPMGPEMRRTAWESLV